MNEPELTDDDRPRVLVSPGSGLLARRGDAVLFFAPPLDDDARATIAEAVSTFVRTGEVAAWSGTMPPHALVDWASTLRVDATIDVDIDETRSVRVGVEPDAMTALTDLVDGVVRAGGFQVELPSVVRPALPHGGRTTAEVAPPQFDELNDLDVTLTPLGPVSYPDDNTDRTTQQPFDVRCSNGHANARLTPACRVCGEPIDTTARRGTPRAATALASLRLPDGRVVPIDQTLVIGRDPQAVAARATDQPRLVRLDAPPTVSRTHLVVRVENRSVTVTDCGSRGRSAVLAGASTTPHALTAWEPAEVSIGDCVQLGGPTSVVIVEPTGRRHADPTERPRDEHA